MLDRQDLGEDSSAGAAAHHAPPRPFSVELVSTEDGLLGLKDVWTRLEEQSGDFNVFASFDWVSAWWRYIGLNDAFWGPKRLHILVLRREGKVTGLAPFMIRNETRFGFPMRKVEFIGWLSADYNGWLFEGDSAAGGHAILEYLSAEEKDWDLIDLKNIPEESETLAALKKALARSKLSHRFRPDARCPYIPIRTNWVEFLESQSKSFRKMIRNNRSRMKSLEAEGLRVRIIEHPHEEAGLLQRMAAVEQRKLAALAKPDPVLTSSKDFFETLLRTLGAAGRIHVALMEKPNQLIAYQLLFRCGRKLWNYTSAYDPAHSHCSPGIMLIPAILDYAFQHQCSEYDFLSGLAPYKVRWAREFHQNTRVVIWSRRWESRLSAFLNSGIRTQAYRWLARLRAR